ncbi:plasmid pRiA4b ORF-3 family protein [Nostoc sp. MG11]|uniref:plasmid pRiA4b ORF-3 family protein n=1 Tax=Nostoc sp. MG11 TaxID=2721166 RepID=UPI0018692925|nr:plasmid pRiA4b ORF-3 family protein [Nostoc sp. MG11]
MPDSEQLVIYQLHIFILGISPMIWRRIKIRSDSTIADLHYIIQIVMGWTDSHLHRFVIHGKDYGIAQIGGMWFSDDPKVVKLSDFGWRMRERFLYEYDFGDNWQHQIRVEAILTPKSNCVYPVCIDGKRACPPEDCGGVWEFMAQKQEYSVRYIASRLSEIVEEGDIPGNIEEIYELRQWLMVEHFDRQKVNQRLQQYVAGDKEMLFEQEIV